MRRRAPLALLAASALVIAACGNDDGAAPATTQAPATTAAETTAPSAPQPEPAPDVAAAGNECTADKTLEPGKFKVATGDPAYFPYVIDDNPESGDGFEAAVIYAVADAMNFAPENVVWVRSGFNEAIAPGPKDFDVNVQQFSITDERSQIVTFSEPYYASNQAVVALEGSPAQGATTLEALKDVKFGAQVGTTSLQFILDVIQPSAEPFVYDDNTAAKAALDAGQIDAIVLDLPTAFYVSAVEIEGSSVVAQFPASAGGTTDEFGMLMAKDNPLKECIDAALAELKASGALDGITQQWMSDFTDAPIIPVG
jgi:polar amino acid transport system substrate-binding protein